MCAIVSFLCPACLGGLFHSHISLCGAGHPADQRSDPARCLWRHPLLYHTKVGETEWCKGTCHCLLDSTLMYFAPLGPFLRFTCSSSPCSRVRCGKMQPLRSFSLCRLLGEASSLSPPTISSTITATGKHTKGKLFFWHHRYTTLYLYVW